MGNSGSSVTNTTESVGIGVGITGASGATAITISNTNPDTTNPTFQVPGTPIVFTADDEDAGDIQRIFNRGNYVSYDNPDYNSESFTEGTPVYSAETMSGDVNDPETEE